MNYIRTTFWLTALVFAGSMCAAPDLSNACDPSDSEFVINQFICLPDGASALATAAAGGTTPEIDITFNSATVPSAGNIPAGNVSTGASYDMLFTITNSGGGTLNLTSGTPVAATGDTGHISVLVQPASTSLTAGQSTTFAVRYAPSALATHTVNLTIANNDADEGSYNISVAGSGQTGWFIMVGDTCLIRRTTNPAGGWSNGTTPGGCTENLNAVAHGNDGAAGKFVAVGDGGRIITSIDRGLNWALATSNTAAILTGVAHGNGTWVAVGATGTVRYTTNPTGSWLTPTGVSGDFQSVSYGNGQWVAVGNAGNICTSLDAITWSCGTPLGAVNFSGTAFGDANFVIVGAAGNIHASNDGGSTWNDNTTAPGNTYKRVAFAGGIFAVATDEFATTTAPFVHNPSSQVQIGSNTFNNSQDITATNNIFVSGGLAFGNGNWIVGATGGATDQVFYNASATLAGGWIKNATGAIGAWKGLSFED